MKKIRQAIINWLFQDDVSLPAQQPISPPSPEILSLPGLPFEQTALVLEKSFPILDLHRMEMTTFYFKGPIHPQDSEPTKEHFLHPSKGE